MSKAKAATESEYSNTQTKLLPPYLHRHGHGNAIAINALLAFDLAMAMANAWPWGNCHLNKVLAVRTGEWPTADLMS